MSKLLATVGIALATTLISSPAAAFDRPVVSDVRVKSMDCHWLPITYYIGDSLRSIEELEGAPLDSGVIRNDVKVMLNDNITDEFFAGAVVDPATDTASGASSAFEWCPADGLGTFLIDISNAALEGYFGGRPEKSGWVIGIYSGKFGVRQVSAFKATTASRLGSIVQVQTQAVYYSIRDRGWRSIPAGTKLALRIGSATNSQPPKFWRYVEVGKYGIAKTSFRMEKAYRYQFGLGLSSSIWSANSPQVRR